MYTGCRRANKQRRDWLRVATRFCLQRAVTLKAISWSYPWLTWIIRTALSSIGFSVKHRSTEQTADSRSKWHKGHLVTRPHCSDRCYTRLSSTTREYVSACLCGWMHFSACSCGRSHVGESDHNSPGFRFLSCSTDSHLAPVPKMVILERTRRRKYVKQRIKKK